MLACSAQCFQYRERARHIPEVENAEGMRSRTSHVRNRQVTTVRNNFVRKTSCKRNSANKRGIPALIAATVFQRGSNLMQLQTFGMRSRARKIPQRKRAPKMRKTNTT